MSYVASKKAQDFYGVSDQTLRRWAHNNKIKFKRTDGGHFRFFIGDSEQRLCKKIIYCRVSSSKQRADLLRQIQFMQEKFPNYEVVSEIGSGLDFERTKFLSLLQRIISGNVSKVVVASQDRFSRFGFHFFTWLSSQFNCKLLALSSDKTRSQEQELSEDLLSIIAYFTAKCPGRRRYKIT